MGRVRRQRQGEDRARHICYMCHQMGHWKLDCPENPDRRKQKKETDENGKNDEAENDEADSTGARGKPIVSNASVLGAVRADADRFNQPLPKHIDITIPGIAKAWEWFLVVDVSGRLDLHEVCELARQLGLKWNKRKLA